MTLKSTELKISEILKCEQSSIKLVFEATFQNIDKTKTSEIAVEKYYENRTTNCCFNVKAVFETNIYPLNDETFNNIRDNKIKPLLEDLCESFSRKAFQLLPKDQ